MGLLDRWRSSQHEQLLASLGPARTGIILLDKRHHNLAQVEVFVESCRAAGFKADFLEFGRGHNAEYRVYSREPDCKDPRLPGEPGFLPLGDLRGAPPEYQAELPPGYHDPLVQAERLELHVGASGSDEFTPFEQMLIELHQRWTATFEIAGDIEPPNRVVLASASAGAAVALGSLGTFVQSQFYDSPLTFPTGAGGELPNRIAKFARALDHANAIEAAYRVVTWTLVTELACAFWRPNYEYEMAECATVFEIRNDYESTVIHYGAPVADAVDENQGAKRHHDLARWSLFSLISAAIDEQCVPGEDHFIDLQLHDWIEQLIVQGCGTAGERLEQLAPGGLPIWE